ncbi:glycosyltransferase, partial [Aeromonas jandaei]|uniref:glycosyltransferase n=1 Tax=Aeromonas jandaei TaxID=650 RepID=UPI000F5247E2
MKAVYLRSHSYECDGRLARYLKICHEISVDFMVFDWDRNGLSKNNKLPHWRKPFTVRAKVGSGIKNIFNLILWNIYLLGQLIRYQGKYQVIHAADVDTLIPALIVAKCFKKHLIFDIYDKYSASREMPTFLARKFDWLESKGIEIAQDVIVPHVCRIEQLGIDKLNLKKDVHIFENIPLVSSIESSLSLELVHSLIEFKQKYNICLAYVGILESTHRGLENLLKAVSETPQIALVVAGSGALSSMFQQASREFDNILYVGQVKPEHAHEILQTADVHVGFYYKSIVNHLYASPNKYYEHLYYGKAMLTNEGVPPGYLVNEYNTGYVIDDTYQALMKCLNSMELDDIKKLGAKANLLWQRKYVTYYSFMMEEYQKILLSTQNT